MPVGEGEVNDGAEAVVGLLVGTATPERAERVVETFGSCPYCASLEVAEQTVIGLFVLPPDHRWWLAFVQDNPRETLGLERAQVFFSPQVRATSPWFRGEVGPVLETSPCGTDCAACPSYQGRCPGCPATRHYARGRSPD